MGNGASAPSEERFVLVCGLRGTSPCVLAHRIACGQSWETGCGGLSRDAIAKVAANINGSNISTCIASGPADQNGVSVRTRLSLCKLESTVSHEKWGQYYEQASAVVLVVQGGSAGHGMMEAWHVHLNDDRLEGKPVIIAVDTEGCRGAGIVRLSIRNGYLEGKTLVERSSRWMKVPPGGFVDASRRAVPGCVKEVATTDRDIQSEAVTAEFRAAAQVAASADKISAAARKRQAVLEKAFLQFDKDNSGFLDRDEMREVLCMMVRNVAKPPFHPSPTIVTSSYILTPFHTTQPRSTVPRAGQ